MPLSKSVKRKVLESRVLSGPGQLDASQRTAAAGNRALSEPAGSFVAKIHRQATEITDEDVAELKAAGLTEDQIFELTVAAATGAGLLRLDKVLSLLSCDT